MTLTDIHGALSNTAILLTFALSIWGYFRFFRKEGVSSSYWGALVIAELLYIVQGVLGVILYLMGERPAGWAHILYGVVSVLIIPGVFAYSKGDQSRKTMLLYASFLLFLAVMFFRSIQTGGG
jgi:CDP-diglyceride synthetase